MKKGTHNPTAGYLLKGRQGMASNVAGKAPMLRGGARDQAQHNPGITGAYKLTNRSMSSGRKG